PARVLADRGAPTQPALRRSGTCVSGLSARPLRRVQPGVRPWHALRPAIRRPHRIDTHVTPAARRMALRLEAGAGEPRGASLNDVPWAKRVGRSRKAEVNTV